MVPPLTDWARSLDLTRLDDGLALAVRQLLGRSGTLTRAARLRLARSLWAEVAAVTSPPPPSGMPDWAYLAAVHAERHTRARQRLARTRSVSTALWPELAPAATGAAPGPTWPVRPTAPPPTSPQPPVAPMLVVTPQGGADR
jgi:hypothetical protein